VKLCILGSGSRGNAVLMQSRDTRILIDAGFSPRALAKRLLSIGVDPRSIQAVLLTHEHYDHMRGVSVSAQRWGWDLYATQGTIDGCGDLSDINTRTLANNASVRIGDFEINAVGISHDATDPVAIVATGCATGVRAGIVYDLGMFTREIHKALELIDLLVIESNHDVEMLRNGPYPPVLKRRIGSREGHLSNRDAAIAAQECAHRGMSHVVLAHLSETNNTPQMATDCMRAALRRTPFKGSILAASQDYPSSTISAERASAFGPAQLSLAL
jgi:phosphoribosyl 1,2-cyclic phosphodiesterase